ncbi:MAG: hypothetical protein H0U00_06350 [Actinobacteria bacterium]|nr:hypothetical protein [Actinomycetota bacterium]
MKRLLLIAAAGVITVVGATVGGAIAPAVAGDGPLPAELREVRAAVAKYHSFKQAENDGYTVAGEPCVPPPPAPPSPAMGIHAVNPPLLADDAVDTLRPEILLYVPKSNGKLELVGVEYWKRDADQDLGTSGDKPSLFGRPFDGPMPGHNPTMPIHYDLHVWVAEANPSGVFAMFNPAISC